MKKTNRTDTNGGVKTDSSCIVWTGPEIVCLDICAGDKLDDLVYAIAIKICEASSVNDLATLSLQCLVDKLQVVLPTEKNLINILQILIDNECKLKDLIDAVNAKFIDPNTPLNLNLGCLAQTDGYGNPILYTQLQLDQVLVNNVCILKNAVSALQVSIADLQTQIDDIDVSPTYPLPTITTCVSTNKPLNVAVTELATAYCEYTEDLGTNPQVLNAIAKGNSCTALNNEFNGKVGWINSPTTEAQVIANLWHVVCNYAARLKVIEQTCCAPTCDKIKIGWTTTFNYDDNTMMLTFGSVAGTFIPPGFEDAGSIITIKDSEGNLLTINTTDTPIVVGGVIEDIPTLDFVKGVLTISIKTNFVLKDEDDNIILTCNDCMSKTVRFQPGCCEILNLTDDPIIIIYTIPSIA